MRRYIAPRVFVDPRGSVRVRHVNRVNRYRPGKATLIVGGVGCALAFLGIAINYFGNGRIEFAHCVLALGLLAFVVWFSGRGQDEE